MKTKETTKTPVLEKFFDRFLYEPEDSKHSVISMLGVASFRVSNKFFIEYLQKELKTEDIEAEFSFIRNKFIHYKPTVDADTSFGVGILNIRVGGDIIGLTVRPISNTTVVIYSTQLFITRFARYFSVDVDEEESIVGRINEIINVSLQDRK